MYASTPTMQARIFARHYAENAPIDPALTEHFVVPVDRHNFKVVFLYDDGSNKSFDGRVWNHGMHGG